MKIIITFDYKYFFFYSIYNILKISALFDMLILHYSNKMRLNRVLIPIVPLQSMSPPGNLVVEANFMHTHGNYILIQCQISLLGLWINALILFRLLNRVILYRISNSGHSILSSNMEI